MVKVEGLPVWSMLAIIEDLADEVEVLVLFVCGISGGGNDFSLF